MKGLRLLLAFDKNLVAKLGDASADDIDNAMVEVAKLALGLRSDDAPPIVIDNTIGEIDQGERMNELDDARR